jgi:hypothetical protein
MGAKLEIVARGIDRSKIIDEFGQLNARIDWMSVRRHELLAKQIRSWYADAEPGSGFTLEGTEYRVVLGPRNMQRRITSMSKVFTRLGRSTFLKHCSIALGILENLLSGTDVDELTVWEQTGPRKLEAVPLEKSRVA